MQHCYHYTHRQEKKTTLTLELFQKDYLNRHFTGNLVQTLKNVPGVHSMDIGAGFSQPMIRGFGFNRIAVSENGIKQDNKDKVCQVKSYPYYLRAPPVC